MDKQLKEQILAEAKGDSSYKTSKMLADKYELVPQTVYSLLGRTFGKPNTSKDKAAKTATPSIIRPIKYTAPEYLQIGDTVLIVDAHDMQHRNKYGILKQSKPIIVELSNGELVNAINVIKHNPDKEVNKPKKKRSQFSRQFKRWVLDILSRNPEMSAAEMGEKLGVTGSAIHQWKYDMRKDARKYPMYSEAMATRWHEQYLSEPKRSVMEEIDDQIAVEEVERSYNFTEGDYLLSATIQSKKDLITLGDLSPANEDGSELPTGHFFRGEPVSVDKVEAFAKMMLGAVKMARALKDKTGS